MTDKALSIFKSIVNIDTSKTVEEQLQTTESLFHTQYNGSNPLLEEAKDLGIYNQLEVAQQQLAMSAFDIVKTHKPEINLADFAYLGFSKRALEELLKDMIRANSFSLDERIDIENKFTRIVNTLDMSQLKRLLMALIILVHYQADYTVSLIAYYLYVNSVLSKEGI